MSKCPVCGYWAYNGYECFDCGYHGSRSGRSSTVKVLTFTMSFSGFFPYSFSKLISLIFRGGCMENGREIA
jgi:hypothetical protein